MAAPPLWQHTVSRTGSVCTIVISGELDLSVSAELKQLLHDELHRPGTTELILDMAAVRFLDSTALTILVITHHQAADLGRVFAVANPGPRCLSALTMTGLDTILLAPTARPRITGGRPAPGR